MTNIESNTGVVTLGESPAASATLQESTLPEHLVSLPGGPWAVWKTAALRGAGFSAEQVYQLADAESARAADEVIAAEEEEARARSAALSALMRESEGAPAEKVSVLRKAKDKLKKGKQVALQGVVGDDTAAAVDAFRVARRHAEEARGRQREVHRAGYTHLSRAILTVARSERFREAVTWQNRHAIRGSIEALLRMPAEGQGSDRRKREELVASYLQRYCLKNDTIGFFGPVGWARLKEEGEAIVIPPDVASLCQRNVRFEAWGIDTLAEKLARGRAIKPWAAPRRSPFIHVEGTSLHLPLKHPIDIPAELAAVLSACDGDRTAKQIALDLLRTPGLPYRQEQDVYRIMESLEARELIRWSFEVPLPYPLNPDEHFRRVCEAIEVEELRRPILEALDELDEARAAVVRAQGDSARLDEAVGELERTFTRLTGAAPTQCEGETYAARTLIYEDCVRCGEVEVGPELLGSLGPPLSLLLTSVRWYTHRVAEACRAAAQEMFDDMTRKSGARSLDFLSFWLKFFPYLFHHDVMLSRGPVAELQARWAAILNVDPQRRRMDYRSDELRPQVEAAFDASRSGWPAARYNSPDVMVAAASADAIRRGDYQLILGEMHAGDITVANWAFMGQNPRAEEFVRAIDQDLPEPRYIPVISKFQPTLTARTSLGLFSPKDYFLEIAFEPAHTPAARSLKLAELMLERHDDGVLFVRTRDNRLRFELVELMGAAMSAHVINTVKLVPSAAHTPRITIDRLVVTRESWAFSPADIEFVQEKDDAARFVAARRWARAHGMPRLAFVKTPAEMKPFFLDFESPIFVNNFAKMIRRSLKAATSATKSKNPFVTVSEMLPTPEQVWLPAPGGNCTSEFRFVTLDMKK